MNQLIIDKLKCEDELDRCDAIEYLSSYIDDDSIADIIINMFTDRNYLVRCEAYEAFYGYKKRNIVDMLIYRLKRERSKCARMYICSTLNSIIQYYEVNREQKQKILECYHKETKLNALIGYWCVFYQIEKDKRYIIKVLDHINHNDYHIRCNVVNFLMEILDDENKAMIELELNKQLEKEESLAVYELIINSLKEFEGK